MTFAVSEPSRPVENGSALWAAGSARWARVAGPLVKAALRSKAPIGQGDSATGRKAGALRDSFTYRSQAAAGSLTLTFRSSVPYVRYVMDGTRPHTIVPRNGRVLHFRTAAGGSLFATRVNHPGTRANHFVSRAITPRIPEIQASFSTIMHEIFGGTQ